MLYKSILNVVVVAVVSAVFCIGCVVDPDDGRYEVVNQSSSWADAKREAERRGGYLAVITSDAEQRTIESLIRNGTRDRYWIGGYCESDRDWKWVTGERMSYTNWAPEAPNNYMNDENYVSICRLPDNRWVFLLGQWEDEGELGGRNNGYIIEFDR